MPEQRPRLLADRYELRVRLGRGTMGTVWRAFDRALGREVAVKEIRQDPSLSAFQRQELRERMIREGRMAARVSHPSVATIHDAIEVDGSPWIIMELVEGRSLAQVVDREGPLPPRLVAEIGWELLGALRAAHAQGILHRDVKPGNVLVTDTGRVVLTDFGIAKSLEDSPLTQTGMVIGSPGYTAPERARGEHTGPESDLWSLGATLYFAVEGRPAYERATIGDTLAALMRDNADPPVHAGPLRPVLDGLLVKDHRARLTAEKAAAMLRRVADTPVSRAQTPPSPSPAPERRDAPPGPAVHPEPAVLPRPAAPLQPAAPQPPAPEPAAPPRLAQPPQPPQHPQVARPSQPPEYDSNATMLVRRPPGALRPPPSGPPVPPAPPVAPVAPAPRPRPTGSDDEITAPRRLPPRPAPEDPPIGPDAPAPPGGLGTDLFAMRPPEPPDVATRARALVLMVVALVAVLLLIAVAVWVFT
ncbi:serine/threonine protein kinase [Microbispora sp. RL4-1S]|uniref:non-specific serine/threonine protein kinase n=1 Tax=Microbispora oryzae TaxID=2806554 RepID=A0A940WNK7_9ACTN|nr:serine/threonine-protein kinase [Microbispora oryzae]MBP2707132.1 serine/threonine protein kinase [Microbispora oryzae]